MSEVWDLAELAATADLEQELDRLARSHGIIRTRQLNGQETWTVLRATLTRQPLSDPRLSNDVHTHAPHGALVPGMSVMLLEQDDPDHSRYRRLVTAAFASRAVRELEPRIVATTRRLLTTSPPPSPARSSRCWRPTTAACTGRSPSGANG
ncbi:hypothetical protein [Streptomyces coeruleorubidus]|uniref:hypothetical protein n=1 Tax=Streptomyces coeruleorubidus TaxID=116188 RepID=UPI0033A16C46